VSYATLFTLPCQACHRYLAHDSDALLFLPPTIRTLSDPPLPYHSQCYRPSVVASVAPSSTSTPYGMGTNVR
jgi:hypothetical protein